MMVHRGTSRPMRAGGLFLLGVAAVAAVIGTASAVSGGGTPQSAPPPEDPGTSSSETAGVGDGKPTTTKPSPATSSTEPAESTTTTPDRPSSSRTTKPAAGDGDGDSVKAVSVRVYNNSTVKGLASRAAEDLRAEGWNVVETDNYSGGRIYTTTAYFRPGTNEQAAAEAIGAEFGMRVAPRFAGIADSSPGVIVIVTKDYAGS